LRLSQAHDASEREAEQIARQVVAMPAPAIAPRERVPLLAARAPASAAQPRAAPAPPQDEVSPELTREIKAELGAGQPLSTDTRSFMEPRFKASFGRVLIHTDGKAASLAARLGASAFTFGRDIFFANGRYQPDSPAGMELLAHELTHTIQQRETVQRQVAPAARDNVVVKERSGPKVQRGIVSRALDWIADKANYIPGFRMLTIVIGRNPINMAKVDRSGENILRALIEFIPGGHLVVEALENHGVMQKGGKFIEDQFAALGDLGAAIRDALKEFIDSLGWSDIFHLGDLWDRAKRIFTAPVDKAIAFGKNLVTGIATLVKDAIIKPLGRWAANNIPKWNLLVGVFGKNPISDEKESPAPALIGAFMELIGQQEVWENIKKGNAVGRAWQWFQGAMKGALALVVSIPGRVISTLKSLTIFDIVTLVGAFKKIVGAFASFVGDFMRWAGTTVLNLLEIIFSVVAPSVVPYLKKAGSAFPTIIKAPGRFISTLVNAGKQGFNQFKAQIVTYLRDALFKWLLGSAEGAGIYFPKSFAPIELLKLGLSVLGLTWANIRNKLVAATNETTVKALETGFDIVVKLVKEGPAAAWEELLKTLSNLKSLVVDAAIDFVKGEVVKIAIEKLVSFLTPAGAFIQAIISIYRTITFIVNKLAEIGRLVAGFIDSIAAFANGVVTAAANKVESVLATGLSLAISFLANFAGLGNIPKKVMEIIKKIRAPVDKALDRVVQWIVATARRLGRLLTSGRDATAPAAGPAPGAVVQRVALERTAVAVDRLIVQQAPAATITAALAGLRTQYGWSSLELVRRPRGAFELRGGFSPTFTIVAARPSQDPRFIVMQVGSITHPAPSTTTPLAFEQGMSSIVVKEILPALFARTTVRRRKERVTLSVDQAQRAVARARPGEAVVYNEPRIPSVTGSSRSRTGVSYPDLFVLTRDFAISIEITLRKNWNVDTVVAGEAGARIHKGAQAPSLTLNLLPYLAAMPTLQLLITIVSDETPDDRARQWIEDFLNTQAANRVIGFAWLIVPGA
jgi:hypothetical protein